MDLMIRVPVFKDGKFSSFDYIDVWSKFGTIYCVCENRKLYAHAKTPQLCSGLKDKKGNFIYQGDKLQFTAHKGFTLKSQILEVVWIDELASFGYIPEDNKSLQYSFSEHDELQEDLLNYCEIVGHIYQ